MPWWYSMGLHITDLDGDGVGDISADQPSYLTVIYSSGAQVSYSTGQSGTHAVADVNKDGWPDIVIGQPYGNSTALGVMLNRGDGTLKPPAEVTIGGETDRLAIADFNRDRKPDIATTVWIGGGQVAVTLGNGDGTFKPPSTYAAGPSPGNKAAGELNHDRYPDLVVVNLEHETIQVLLNDGNWTAPVPPPPPSVQPMKSISNANSTALPAVPLWLQLESDQDLGNQAASRMSQPRALHAQQLPWSGMWSTDDGLRLFQFEIDARPSFW